MNSLTEQCNEQKDQKHQNQDTDDDRQADDLAIAQRMANDRW